MNETPTGWRAETGGPGLIELDGRVRRSLANDLYEVVLEDGRQVLIHLSTSVRLRATRVGAGDRVRVELARYDQTRGRIVGRLQV